MSEQLFISMLVGKIISHAWYGDYAALYLELGNLSKGHPRKNGSLGNAIGEITVFAGYDWNAEFASSKLRGWGSTIEQRESLASRILGSSIVFANMGIKSNELEIIFSTGVMLVTRKDRSRLPDWSISDTRTNPTTHLSIGNGGLQIERDPYPKRG